MPDVLLLCGSASQGGSRYGAIDACKTPDVMSFPCPVIRKRHSSKVSFSGAGWHRRLHRVDTHSVRELSHNLSVANPTSCLVFLPVVALQARTLRPSMFHLYFCCHNVSVPTASRDIVTRPDTVICGALQVSTGGAALPCISEASLATHAFGRAPVVHLFTERHFVAFHMFLVRCFRDKS